MQDRPREITGVKVTAAEAQGVAPDRWGTLLPEGPAAGEVEGQVFCTLVHCPYCGATGRCAAEVTPGTYFRCGQCGALFRT